MTKMRSVWRHFALFWQHSWTLQFVFKLCCGESVSAVISRMVIMLRWYWDFLKVTQYLILLAY